ncbi:MAG: pseudaminic acid cytidylyltransferase [Rhodospirillaceae bacterium]
MSRGLTVALIPARGGSKRIPNKNIKLFAGQPVIAYSIRAAKAAGIFDRIIVSTDSDAIADVAKVHGAEVPFRRPAAVSDDMASTEAVLEHALRWLSLNGTPAAYGCCIYPTAPFVTAEDIVRGFKILKDSKSATAFTVTTFASPIFRALKKSDSGALTMVWPENRDLRSQDFPEAFHDAGQFYWFDVQRFLGELQLFSVDSTAIPLPRHRVQDIDTLEDWRRAERMYAAQQD